MDIILKYELGQANEHNATKAHQETYGKTVK